MRRVGRVGQDKVRLRWNGLLPNRSPRQDGAGCYNVRLATEAAGAAHVVDRSTPDEHNSTTHSRATLSDSFGSAPVDQPQIVTDLICRSDLGGFLLQAVGVAVPVDDEAIVGGLPYLLDLILDHDVEGNPPPVDLPDGGGGLDAHSLRGGGEMADVDPDADAVLTRPEIGTHRLVRGFLEQADHGGGRENGEVAPNRAVLFLDEALQGTGESDRQAVGHSDLSGLARPAFACSGMLRSPRGNPPRGSTSR